MRRATRPRPGGVGGPSFPLTVESVVVDLFVTEVELDR